MLDLFYLAVGGAVLSVFWAFTKACNKPEENNNAQHHRRNYSGRDEIEQWTVSLSLK